ncbi:NUDIX hydrolase [Ruegeria atlantica]|uniref:NUDIX hydrolase n=1 Tax=Ruegeria atlantica TaxID=81569 RepID=UPI0032B50517
MRWTFGDAAQAEPGDFMTQTPKIGALAVVLHQDQVLLVQRSKQPDAGLWGFPGGHVEWGETVLQAAQRELREETSVIADPQHYLDNLDLLRWNENGDVQTHYLLVGVACQYQTGDPNAGDDALDARWFPVDQIRRGELEMSNRVIDLLETALRRT